MRRPLLVACAWALLTLFSSPVRAQTGPLAAACPRERPWVALGGNVSPALAESVRSELRAGLLPSQIEVCAATVDAAAEPLARVTLTQKGEGGARYSLDVIDSVTQKRVGRDLSLDKLPPDGRALALAVAAEELLRASWAELALRGPRSTETAPPPEVRAIVEQARPEPPPARRSVLGARLAFERFLGGQTHYGADLFAGVPFGSLGGLLAAVGARRGLSVQAAHGSIEARALSGELGLSLRLLRRAAFELGGAVSGRVLWLSFEPRAAGTAQASAESGLSLLSRGGAWFTLGYPGVLRSYSSLGVGVPLRSFSASDSGAEVTGTSELELFAATGLALELP